MLMKYLQKVRHLFSCFIYFKVEHVPRELNFRVDPLSNLVTTKVTGFNKIVIHETLAFPNIEAGEIYFVELVKVQLDVTHTTLPTVWQTPT